MNLSWSEDQQLLMDSAQRFAARYYTPEVRLRSLGHNPVTHTSPDVWRDLAEFGWLGVIVPPEAGGFGGGALEVGILSEQAGRCLLLEPYLWSALESVRLIQAVASPAVAEHWLAQISSGALRVSVAHTEAAMPGGLDVLETTAERTPSGWRLLGQKRFVMDAGAQVLLCTARVRDTGRVAVFLVRGDQAGARCRPFQTLDERSSAHFEFPQVELTADALLSNESSADVMDAIVRSREAVGLALCSEAIGAMEHLLEATVRYTQDRQQFGRPLSANQVLRHRMVDMAVAIRETRALALRAAILEDDPVQSREAKSRARLGATAKATQATRLVAEEAIQMHGAMGVTEELSVGLYVKRLLLCQMWWGPLSVQHQERSRLDLAHLGLALANASDTRVEPAPWI
jgi:alkylation response protein AidB-like acyl-CoA dehydrogenase